MTWTAQHKDIFTTDTKSWPSPHPNVIGRALTKHKLTFSPQALYLAAARSSHLHWLSSAITAPEFQMNARLIEPHVEEAGTDFGILKSAASFKDFVGTYFTGTVAAGIAYLVMANEGYVWAAHFEGLGGGAAGVTKSPDFAFLGPHPCIALMESKGSASNIYAFKKAVREGYRDQVRPHLGHAVGGVIATHGYCVGSWLRTGTVAEVHVHQTRSPAAEPDPEQVAEVDAQMEAAIKRQNFATAFTLAHGGALGHAISNALVDVPTLEFVSMSWRGRRWLATFGISDWTWPDGPYDLLFELWGRRGLRAKTSLLGRYVFAIEQRVAKTALSSFLGDPAESVDRAREIAPLGPDLLGELNHPAVDDPGGAMLPDGLR